MKSLTGRAIAVVLLAELLCALAFSGSALWHERRIRLRSFDVMLQGRSDSLLGAIQDAEDPEDNVAIDPTELRVAPEDVYAVYTLDGRLLGASRGAPPELITRLSDGFRDRRLGRHRYRILERGAKRVIDRAETHGVGLQRPVTILYAAPMDHVWHEILEAAQFYLAVSLCSLAITAALMILLLRRVLQPIQALAEQAAAVSTRSLIFKAPASALALRELRPLANTLETTIEGLRLAFDKEHRFFSDATHELKTAVAVVRSTVQLLMLKPRSRAEYEEGLTRLLLDNGRVEGLVSQMLLLARLDEKSQTGPGVIDLAESVHRAVGSVSSLAEDHGIDLVLAVPGNVPVRLFPEQAEILVSNLVVNAVQHSVPGSIVEVSLVRHDQTATLRVRDQGAGIAPESQAHVFDRFYREDASRSRDTGGAGLGLAICKAIVDGAGGSISIESAKGVGTTVTGVLRLASAVAVLP